MAGSAIDSFPGQWPWLASIFHNELGFLCGSSIISEWHLIGAAHCVRSPPFDYYTLLGRFDLANDTEPNFVARNISEIFVHEDFNPKARSFRSSGDIAIFKVGEKIKFSDFIQPICLPADDVSVVDVTGFVAGYGRSGFWSRSHESKPKHAELRSIGLNQCFFRNHAYSFVVSERSFCAGHDTVVPCQGDSGGGFYVYNSTNYFFTIIGIVSQGINSLCNPKDMVVFVEVPKFMPWIQKYLDCSLSDDGHCDASYFCLQEDGCMRSSCTTGVCGENAVCEDVNFKEFACRCMNSPETHCKPGACDEVCPPVDVSLSKVRACFLHYSPGNCTFKQKRFFFDASDGICKQFTFTGCDGNDNNFESIEECEEACSALVDVCSLKPVVGRCYNNLTRWFFDSDREECLEFAFTGCDGNANNFDDRDACELACSRKIAANLELLGSSSDFVAQNACHQDKDIGSWFNCNNFTVRYFYNRYYGSCDRFYFSQCVGNDNNFATEAECKATCVHVEGAAACEVPAVEDDSCYDRNWFYDRDAKTCKATASGRCLLRGRNRFKSEGECVELCGKFREIS